MPYADAPSAMKIMKQIDIAGQRFGALTVTGRAPRTNGRTMWNCRCDCGRDCVQEGYSLRKGIITSCGCGKYRSAKRKGKETGVKVDYTGQKFGRLTAIRRASKGDWLWRCDCGNETLAKPGDVKKGNPASCGCLLRESSRSRIVDGNVLGFYDGTSVSALRSIVSGKVRSTNTSGVTGVTVRRNAASITYKARIMVRGETINLGTYATIEEAIEARKRAENAYFREIINNYEKRIENGLPESTEENK